MNDIGLTASEGNVIELYGVPSRLTVSVIAAAPVDVGFEINGKSSKVTGVALTIVIDATAAIGVAVLPGTV